MKPLEDFDTLTLRASVGVIEILCMISTVIGNSLVISAIIK